MVASELKRVGKPKKEEWLIIQNHFADGDLSFHIFTALQEHAGWFDLLDSLGCFQDWLNSEDDRRINITIQYLAFPVMQDLRSKRIAELIMPICNGSDELWQKRIMRILSWGKAHKSQEMKDIFLAQIATGAFDDNENKRFWNLHHEAEDQSPKFLVDAIKTWFEHAFKKTTNVKAWDHLEDNKLNRSSSGAHIVRKVSAKEPEYFVEQMLPLVTAVILKTEYSSGGEDFNRMWPSLSNDGAPYRISEAILLSLRKSLQHLARHSPTLYRQKISSVLLQPHQTFGYLLLQSWAENPIEFADECAEYLIADQRRLNIGYGSWIGDHKGEGKSAISRIALSLGASVWSSASRKSSKRVVLCRFDCA